MKKQTFLLLACLFLLGHTFCQNADSTAAAAPAATEKKELSRKEKDEMAKGLTPAEGKALVYILRPTAFGALIRMTVKCDTVPIGSTKANNYIYAMLDPGPHTLISHSENTFKLDITLEAGKTYYIKQQVKMGIAIAETGLVIIDEQEGQKYLKKCKLAKDNPASN